jgi:hypothetical protein
MGLLSFAATIGGTAKTLQDVRMSAVVNGVGEASFVVDDPTGTYVPADDAAVVISLGGAAYWGGEVSDVDVTWLGHTGVRCTVTAQDYNILARRGLLNTVIPSQSLKTTLTALCAGGGALGVNGVTLSGSQATGPTLGDITAPWWTAETLLNHLASLTGYVWRINASKVLEMWDVGTKSSGVTLSLANGNVLAASWRRHRFDYVNRVWVVYGPTPSYEFVQDAGEVASKGEWNRAVSAPDVLTATEAAAYGAAVIAAGLPRPQMPTVATRADGIDPGETLVVDLSDLGLSAVTVLAQRVDASALKADSQADVEYALTCAAGDVAQATALDLWRRMLSGATASSALVTGGGGGGGSTTVVNGVLEGDLGGSRQVGVSHSTWTPTKEYRDWECPADGTYRAVVEVWTDDAGTSVTPRVYDVTGASVAQTGASSTSTTPATQTLSFSAVAAHVYRLQVLPGNTAAAVYGIGKVRP